MTNFRRKLLDRIKYQLLKIRDTDRERIFVIGLSKTGTTSICEALNMLGYNSVHFAPIIELHNDDIRFKWPWYLERYDAFGDIPVSYFYELLDKKFNNAKFILTTRDKKHWLESAEKHFSVPSKHPLAVKLHEDLYGSDIYQESLFSESYDKFHDKVNKHFNAKKNFLTVDIFTETPWPLICGFLNKEIPEADFPTSNARIKLSTDEKHKIIRRFNLPNDFSIKQLQKALDESNISTQFIKTQLLYDFLTKDTAGHPNVIGYYKEILISQ